MRLKIIFCRWTWAHMEKEWIQQDPGTSSSSSPGHQGSFLFFFWEKKDYSRSYLVFSWIQAGVCFTQAAGISIFECGLFGIVCFSQTDTTALPHSLELSQCLQTPQQTLPHHPAVARQHRRSRFQREQSHERLHGESISMGECQK